MNQSGHQPHGSGVTPRYKEVAVFMRAAQAPITPDLDIALAGVAAEIPTRGRQRGRMGEG